METGFTHAGLMEILQRTFKQLPDYRTGQNTRYAIGDAAAGAFGVFFTQSPSFLSYQRDMQRKNGQNNAQSLFGVEKIPSDNQIRNLLDPIGPEHLYAPFWEIYAQLKARGTLNKQRGHANNWLCAMDGVQYFTSKAIHCENCNETHKDGTVRYYHAAITPVLVAPDSPVVISLEPEFITPQDGSEKQDCEQNAIKRWIERNASHFAPHTVTILADDLHSHQPLCELLLSNHFNFILVCKPDSHKALYEEIALLDKIAGVSQVKVRRWNGRFHEKWLYRYVNQVPLRGGEHALQVNWCELTITHESEGTQIYHNSFVTNHLINDATVKSIVASGRARWKTENECNNVLKNHGYHLAHNFGHGQQHLSSVLVTLNLLAFLCHTVLDLTSFLYQRLRRELGTRQTFFGDIRTLTRYSYFPNWQALLDHMAKGLGIGLSSSP